MTHLYGPLECCALSIFSFLPIKDIVYYYHTLGNRTIQLSLRVLIHEYKYNNLYFTKIFSNQFTKEEIQTCPLLFLTHFKTFQNYLFSLFDKYDTPLQILFFQNKLNKLFAIKQISTTMILFMMKSHEDSIYYTLLESPNSHKLDTLPQEKRQGYAYRDGDYTPKMEYVHEFLERT